MLDSSHIVSSETVHDLRTFVTLLYERINFTLYSIKSFCLFGKRCRLNFYQFSKNIKEIRRNIPDVYFSSNL